MMEQDHNFGVAFLNTADRVPTAIALRAPNQEMTYDQLRTRVIRYALHMRLRGIDRDSCIALDTNRMPEGLALTIAIALLGARWVRLTPEVPYDVLKITHVLSLGQPKYVPHRNFYVVDESWIQHPSEVDPLTPVVFQGFASEDEIACFNQSSGTTGRPKFIARSYASVWRQLQQYTALDRPTRYLAFPPLSGVGFSSGLRSVTRGMTIVVAPRDLQQAIALGAEYVVASPAQIDQLSRSIAPLPRRIPLLAAAGSIVTPSLVRRWLQYFEEVEMFYGSQEAGVVGRWSATEITDGDLVAYALNDDVEVEIIDESGALCPPDARGIVRIKTPQMISGYVGAPDATTEAFRDGWFYPGDLGSLSKDRLLQIHGRVKDQYNLGGVKANAADVDEAASRAPGVQGAVSFTRRGETGIDELGVLAILAEGTSPEQAAEEIRRHCAGLRGKDLVPKSIHFADHLPLNESGKPMREVSREISRELPAY